MAIIILIIITLIIAASALSKRDTHISSVNDTQHSFQKTKDAQICDVIIQEPTPSLDRATNEPLPTFKYDINNMTFLYHCDPDEDVYGISPMYWDIMSEDILRINTLLDEAAQKCQAVPGSRIKKEHINFKPNRQFDDEFTRFVYSPFTPTGKISKFPYYIKFALNGGFSGEKCLFGNIYFTKDNKIGKAWIVSWLNHKCYTINCAIKDKQLQVTRIDVTTADNYSKTCLYNYNAK